MVSGVHLSAVAERGRFEAMDLTRVNPEMGVCMPPAMELSSHFVSASRSGNVPKVCLPAPLTRAELRKVDPTNSPGKFFVADVARKSAALVAKPLAALETFVSIPAARVIRETGGPRDAHQRSIVENRDALVAVVTDPNRMAALAVNGVKEVLETYPISPLYLAPAVSELWSAAQALPERWNATRARATEAMTELNTFAGLVRKGDYDALDTLSTAVVGFGAMVIGARRGSAKGVQANRPNFEETLPGQGWGVLPTNELITAKERKEFLRFLEASPTVSELKPGSRITIGNFFSSSFDFDLTLDTTNERTARKWLNGVTQRMNAALPAEKQVQPKTIFVDKNFRLTDEGRGSPEVKNGRKGMPTDFAVHQDIENYYRASLSLSGDPMWGYPGLVIPRDIDFVRKGIYRYYQNAALGVDPFVPRNRFDTWVWGGGEALGDDALWHSSPLRRHRKKVSKDRYNLMVSFEPLGTGNENFKR